MKGKIVLNVMRNYIKRLLKHNREELNHRSGILKPTRENYCNLERNNNIFMYLQNTEKKISYLVIKRDYKNCRH